jgi:THO complex subunit 2
MHPENECYIGVLREFKKVSLAHIVGFKFQFYTRDGGVITTPQSLYRLAAILIHHGLLEIDDLLPHLSPTREDIIEQFQKHAKKLEAAAKSFGKVNLAAKSSENDEVSCESHDSSLVGANQVFGLIGGLVEIGSVSLGFEMIKWFRARDVDPLMFSPLARVICELLHSKLKSLFNPLSKRHLGFSFSNGKLRH